MHVSALATALAFIGSTTARIPVHGLPSHINHHTVTGHMPTPAITNIVFHRPPGKRATTITSLEQAFVTQIVSMPGQVVDARPREIPKVADVVACAAAATVTQTVTGTATQTVTGTVTLTVTGFVQSHPLQSHPMQSNPAPTPVAGSVMDHLEGLPWQYQHCFHNEEQAAARATTFHAKFTYPITEWCKGGWEANNGISPAVWIEQNIVPCVDFYFSGPEYFRQGPDRTKVRHWLEKVCGTKKFKLDHE